MPLSREIQKMVDAYADGKLSVAEVRKLAELLKESDEVREQLALAAVLERLLRALGKGSVPTDKIMSRVKSEGTKPEPDPPVTKPKQRITAPGIIKSPVGSSASRNREPGFLVRAIAFVVIVSIIVVASTMFWKKWKEYESFTAQTTTNRPGTTSTTMTAKTSSVANTQNTYIDNPANPTDLAKPLDPFFSEEIPPPPEGEDLSPPAGNGENEPGFVPPPKKWLEQKEDASEEDLTGQESVKPLAPILCTKIKHGGLKEWAVTPDDVSSLLKAMQKNSGVRYGMNVKSFNELGADPADNPILFFSGHYNFVLEPAQRRALRQFILRGGMIIFNAGLGSKPFYNSARREMRLILPELPIKRLGADHPVFHSRFDIYDANYSRAIRNAGYFDKMPWLEGITISCRTAVVISRWGMAAGWEGKENESYLAYRANDAQRLGINLMAYGASIRAWAKRALGLYDFKQFSTRGTDAMLIAQIRHNGEWRTRFAGLTLLLDSFNRRTEVPVKLNIKSMSLMNDELFNMPLIYITGHEAIALNEQERKRLKDYIANGGFLFAEACCGRKGFDKDFRKLMADLFPKNPLKAIPTSHDIFNIPNKIELLGVTPALGTTYGAMLIPPGLEGVKIDNLYSVVYSPYGMAGSWESSQTPYAYGYEDPDTLKLGQNILMYAITQ